MASRYIFKLTNDYQFKSHKVVKNLDENLYFYDRRKNPKLRLIIAENGTITVKKDYAWDGCSPKICVLDLFWLGTPDGVINENKPVTYYASLVHDALGQFSQRDNMPFNRQERDLIFLEMLEEKKFFFSWLYYIAVAIFGVLYSHLFPPER